MACSILSSEIIGAGRENVFGKIAVLHVEEVDKLSVIGYPDDPSSAGKQPRDEMRCGC